MTDTGRPTPEELAEFRSTANGPDWPQWGHEDIKMLLAEIDALTDRVVADGWAKGDAEDLQRENAELRAMLADAPTGEAAIAKLREWSSQCGPEREWQPGAALIAMPVAMAIKIIGEIDRLTELVANKDESTSELFAANLDLREQLAGLKVEWSPRASDGSFSTKSDALRAAAERYGNGPVDDDEVAWRLVGRWRDADEYQAGEGSA